MTKPVHAQAGAGSAFHRPFCPDGRAALGLRFEAGCPEQNRPFLLVATIIASAMAFIDATVVTIALPPLQGAIAEAMMVATNRKGRFCSNSLSPDLKPNAARPSGQKGPWKALPALAWEWTGLVMTTAWLLPFVRLQASMIR